MDRRNTDPQNLTGLILVVFKRYGILGMLILYGMLLNWTLLNHLQENNESITKVITKNTTAFKDLEATIKTVCK